MWFEWGLEVVRGCWCLKGFGGGVNVLDVVFCGRVRDVVVVFGFYFGV